jgi:hypothetical protein
MATTTNYGWTTPDDTALVKDGAAAIRTLGSSVDTTTKALNPSTTLGDIEYRSSTANTNTRLGIGSTGQVLTVSGGVPAWAASSAAPFVGVSLSNTTSQSIPNATQTALTFDTEQFDTDGFHSTSTNTSRITIPAGKAGKYQINGLINLDTNTSGTREFSLFVNGSTVFGLGLTPSASGPGGVISCTRNLSVGDYIELFAWNTSGTARDFTKYHFSATYLGA